MSPSPAQVEQYRSEHQGIEMFARFLEARVWLAAGIRRLRFVGFG